MKQTFTLISFLCASVALMAQSALPAMWVMPKRTIVEQSTSGNGRLIPFETTGWELIFADANLPQGTYVEADFSFKADTKNAPLHYIFEVLDGHTWTTIDTIKATMENPVNSEFATSLNTFLLHAAVDTLRLRLRAVEKAENPVLFAHKSNVGAYVAALGTAAPTDTLRVLCIGNSFSYVYQTPYMLKQLAWSQGHYIDMEAALRGGYAFADHLLMQGTNEAIQHGNYDFVFLQNQSQTNAWYAQDTVAKRQLALDADELVRRIRLYSPNAKIVIESTWAYTDRDFGSFGSVEHFDELMEQGSEMLAKRSDCSVSYINRAFQRARQRYPKLQIYGGDNCHQSDKGSYLKSCVNYRIIYGSPLPVRPRRIRNNNASADLWFDAKSARQLRHSAK